MTPNMSCLKIEINHVKPISSFEVSSNEKLKKPFKWKNTQTLVNEVHHYKGTKIKFLENRSQFVKVYQFLKTKKKGT